MASRASQVFVFADTDNGGVIHVANIKGGVGKSTVATNLAAALGKKGPTLLIDLDAQGSATFAYGRDPAEFSFSSWDLFRHRYSPESSSDKKKTFRLTLPRLEAMVFSPILGVGNIAKLCVRIEQGLDLIPANGSLFNTVRSYHLENFLFNLEILREFYKYIILDTPSVWNRLTRMLYCKSDLNLIPVTLNALSTRSLREYLINVKKLSNRNTRVRVRIVKNEVYGRQDSAIKGKTRTMFENRKFLESLCEQIVVKNETGVSVIPQTMMFDLEIPESATVRDAQDEGLAVAHFKQYSTASKAFFDLAQKVQYVLNTKSAPPTRNIWDRRDEIVRPFVHAAGIAGFAFLWSLNPKADNQIPPRPIAPVQLVVPPTGSVAYTTGDGEPLFRIAKYSICHFKAIVPDNEDIYRYLLETLDIYNRTRFESEQKIASAETVPSGITLHFYPPSTLSNPREKQILPAYEFFMSLVQDKYPYITGDWCERGTGGGTPHYGIDIAGTRGSEIICPIDGTAYLLDNPSVGKCIGVVRDGTVLFFAHMDQRYFNSGEHIKKGMPLGKLGLTGHTSGPHVHVGYGLKSPAADGLPFGNSYYKVTDPKLFFYRQAFIASITPNE